MHKMTHIHMHNTKQSAGLCVAKVLPQVEIVESIATVHGKILEEENFGE